MKLEKLFFATVLSGLAFTACVDNDDKSEWNDGSQPISFTSFLLRGLTPELLIRNGLPVIRLVFL